MLNSCIKPKGGHPTLYIEGTPVSAMAYTTYFEERSGYEAFLAAGYRIFFVNASFTKKPINNITGFTPFRVGIYEDPEHPDYSEFEDAVKKILNKCPDAVIFPRINISMPSWWIEKNEDECVNTLSGGLRENLASDVFKRDGERMLTDLVRHVKKQPYEKRIAGWQLCGGTTQEWFHHDLCGSLSPSMAAPYRDWVRENYGDNDARLPLKDEFEYKGVPEQSSENARRYSLFSNLAVASTLDFFANALKRETDNTQVVGAFYGYSLENNGTVLFGTHAIRALLDSPNLDFFSSPNAYTKSRALGIDWEDMLPIESLKLHGKLPFIECDIRTYLTKAIQDVRPGEYPDDIYRTKDGASVWSGPESAPLSVFALRKSFAHQITRGSAIWWFDMWGGWYDDPMIMRELADMKSIYDSAAFDKKAPLSHEVVFFTDETGYANLYSTSPELRGIYTTREAMGRIGAPYAIFAVEDSALALTGCKAAIFPFPIPSDAGKRAMALCEELGIPYLSASPEHCALSADRIRSFIKTAGVQLYSEDEDVVYSGCGYVGLHSSKAGEKVLSLPKKLKVTPLFGTNITEQITDTVRFYLDENGTALFSLEDI